MTKPMILVTGATGKTGGAVVARLLQLNWPVRAVVSRRDARSERLQSLGVETVVADMYDPEQLLDAMRGTSRAYFLPIFRPYMIQSAAAFAVAAREAKLESVVQMSQWTSSPSHPAILTRQTWLVDRLFAHIPGVAHTIVNPGMFADNFLRTIDMAALLGVFPLLTGTSKSAPVSNEDIARVVAEILTDPAPHAGKTYRPTGPKLLSGREMAEAISRAVGNRVRPVTTPVWMLSKVARLQGVDPFEIASLRYYLRDHALGAFEFEGGVTDVVQELTGTPAEEFEATARRYAALPFARKTLTNRVRALVNFGLVPVVPGYNLDRYEREHAFPRPADPRLTLESETWIREHARLSPLGGSADTSVPATSPSGASRRNASASVA